MFHGRYEGEDNGRIAAVYKAQYKANNACESWATIGTYGTKSEALQVAEQKKSSGALMVRVIDKNGSVVTRVIRTIDDLLLNKAVQRRRYNKKLARQLNELESGLDYKFVVYHKKNERDLVSQLCDKYGSDKGGIKTSGQSYPWPLHTYADFYSRLFSHCRQSVKKVFECGLGTNNPDLVSSMGAHGKPGASLRVWRDYFPNATVYGADIDRDILFEEDRIRTFYIDQLDPTAIAAFWQRVGIGDFDFMLDDGLHTFEAGSCLFEHSVSRLAQDGVYIIEDVGPSDLLRYKNFFSKTDYAVDYVTMFRPNVRLGDNNLVVIRKS